MHGVGMFIRGAIFAAVAATPLVTASAKGDAVAESPPSDEKASDAAREPVVTQHTIDVDGQTLRYTATAGTLPNEDDAGKRLADVFFIAYAQASADAEEAGESAAGSGTAGRPITFVFNGGPGAAAVWLHLGTAGPRVLQLTDAGEVPPPPPALRDNAFTWLTATDLVLIDPVGTGFSRAAQGTDPQRFYSVEGDIAAVGEFIRRYLTRYGRWDSPKFLAGESYGTTRAAGLADHLLDREGVALNGVMLISTVLDFGTLRADGNNLLPFALYLPTYAATAHRHGRLPEAMQSRPLGDVTAEAETWALTGYLAMLVQDDALPDAQRAAGIERLAGFTGLPADLIDDADLRIAPSLFQKELLGDEGLIVGRFDARLTGAALDPLRRHPSYDPSLTPYLSAYTSAFNAYVRAELGYETDLKYEVLSDRVHPWDFGGEGSGFLDVTGRLRAAMIKQPSMQVFIASGRYDLATPYLATRFTINSLDLPAPIRKNLRHALYPAGHMMYHDQASLSQLHRDIEAFIADAAPPRQTPPPPEDAGR